MNFDFFDYSANLKNIQRQGWIDKVQIKNPESVADHSYSMAVMSMVISDLEGYDTEKILKMTILHDLAESAIGDLTPDQITREKKRSMENKAFVDIAFHLPESIRSSYLQIWNEYLNHDSPESKIVHQIDRLEMALQARLYVKQGYLKEKMTPFFDSAKEDIVHPKIKELFGRMMSDI